MSASPLGSFIVEGEKEAAPEGNSSHPKVDI